MKGREGGTGALLGEYYAGREKQRSDYDTPCKLSLVRRDMSGVRSVTRYSRCHGVVKEMLGSGLQREWVERQESVVSQTVGCMKLRQTLGSDLGSETGQRAAGPDTFTFHCNHLSVC